MSSSAATWNYSALAKRVLDEIPVRLAPLAPKIVMLFGSRARGSERPDSDFDLLVVMDLPDPDAPRTPAVRARLRGLGVPFDVVVYSPDEWESYRRHPLALAHQIEREGKVLYAAA